MGNILKRVFVVIFLGLFLLAPKIALAQEDKVNLYFFWSKTCPHCAKEKEFFTKIEPEYPNLVINGFEISDPESNLLLRTIGERLKIDTGGVPITIIGKDYFVGYYNDEITGQTIIDLHEKYESEGDPDVIGSIIQELFESETIPSPTTNLEPSITKAPAITTPFPTETPTTTKTVVDINSIDKTIQIPDKVDVPFLGSINIKDLSLPVVTIILGGLDGFNPCAMWTLLFLISLLLGMKDKKRRWILGTTFIVASGFVYFLFMAAWLNLLLFVGFIVWVRVIIGLIALGGGGYNLKEYLTNKDGGCKVTGGEKRKRVFDKLRDITQQKQFLLALGGIILLAFAVNLVELICSAGLPVVFTQILVTNNLSSWQYYLYMILYIFIFMLDDLFVFFTAMFTLEMTGLSTKYVRLSHLIGGILMIIIGILIIFKPELLMFG